MFACSEKQKDHNLTSISKFCTEEKPLTKLIMPTGYGGTSEFLHKN
jgi:hypothetical protein